MAMREVDAIDDAAISRAIIATDKEIAGAAWDQEDVTHDESGDRTVEQMGEGLEGQHDPDDDDEAEGEDAGDASESEDDEEGEAEPDEVKEPEGEAKPDKKTEGEKEGRVPSGRVREATERARAAEAERDALKAAADTSKQEYKSLADKLDLALRQIDDLRRTPQKEAKPADAGEPKSPDFFEDPAGFIAGQTKPLLDTVGQLQQQLAAQRVETSMAIAHSRHGETFAKAFEAVGKLNPQNPDDRAIVQRIYSDPSPGEALVAWHKRTETLREVGDDPVKYREKIEKEARERLAQDPEFRKSLIEGLRAEASRGEDGKPNTTVRLPKSLNGAAGGNRRDADVSVYDDNDQAIAASAWR